jgi:hypothetical protein
MITSQLLEHHVTHRSIRPVSSEINRLLAAATVSRQFCALLLVDPARAIAQGFAGERFSLSADEYEIVLSARSSSLAEFARQLCKHLPGQTPIVEPILPENYQGTYLAII